MLIKISPGQHKQLQANISKQV